MKRWEIRVILDDASAQASFVDSAGFPEIAMLEALSSPVRWDGVLFDEDDPEAGVYTCVAPAHRIERVLVREAPETSKEPDADEEE